MLRFAASALNSTASARSIFVITATSALLKIVGYLSGFFFPLRNGHEDEPKIFAEIVRRWTNEIAHVLDEQEIELVKLPAFERILHHRGFEMANGSGDNLFHWGLAPREPHCIIFRGEVAHQRGHAKPLPK